MTTFQRTPDPRQASTRKAFTLVELLVVIAIIAILGALTTAAVFKWIDTQRQNNSEALVKAVAGVLDQHWKAVIAESKKETIPPVVMAMANQDRDRAQVIWTKLRLAEAFPMSYYEVWYYGGFFDHVTSKAWVDLFQGSAGRKYQAGYVKKINGLKVAPVRETESAACLLIALSVARGNAPALDVDMLPIRPLDTDGDGVKELVDGFGAPIAFFRFPTLNPDLQNANPSKTVGDPLDTIRSTSGAFKLTQQPGWWSMPAPAWSATYNMRQIYQEVCRYTLADLSGNPRSFYSTPVIVARGPNGKLGLKELQAPPTGAPNLAPPSPQVTWHTPGDYPDMSVLDPQLAEDNIYSFKLKAPE